MDLDDLKLQMELVLCQHGGNFSWFCVRQDVPKKTIKCSTMFIVMSSENEKCPCVIQLFVVVQLVYHSLQLVAFAVLAVLIMRLKLFLTPHMCIMASLICSKQVCPHRTSDQQMLCVH